MSHVGQKPQKWDKSGTNTIGGMLVVITTAPNTDEAEVLAERIVGEKLAACVQILPQMTSFYFWEGKVQKEGEYLLLIKTHAEKFDELKRFIHENHSYDVPEIVAIETEKVSEDYLAWMAGYLGLSAGEPR